MPSIPPERVRLWTASTTMRVRRPIIIHFVIRSRPFCRPKLTTKKPASTVRTIHAAISTGSASMAENTPSTASEARPSKAPPANLKK